MKTERAGAIIRSLLEAETTTEQGRPELIAKMDDYGAYVTVEGGTLLSAAMREDGSPEMDSGSIAWSEVSAPESQDFLDAVNGLFGTDFKMDQFAGR